jgi:hypothetical protein
MITHLSDHKHHGGLEPLEALRQKVCRAIVTIHAEGRYYDGLDLLCAVAGWPSFRNELYSPEMMDAWISEHGAGKENRDKAKGAGLVKKTSIPDPCALHSTSTARPAPTHRNKMCSTCHRYYKPGKIYQRISRNPCAECCRRINKRNGETL